MMTIEWQWLLLHYQFKVPLSIQDPSVVSKSYPDFWNDLIQLNFDVKNR